MKTSQEKYHENQTNVEDDEEGWKAADKSRRIREVTSPRSIAKMRSL